MQKYLLYIHMWIVEYIADYFFDFNYLIMFAQSAHFLRFFLFEFVEFLQKYLKWMKLRDFDSFNAAIIWIILLKNYKYTHYYKLSEILMGSFFSAAAAANLQWGIISYYIGVVFNALNRVINIKIFLIRCIRNILI